MENITGNGTPNLSTKSPSLRSFPLDSIALLPPLAKSTFGNNTQSRKTDVGSIDFLSKMMEQQTEQPIHSTLKVCKHCQDTLLGAFDHCLSKHGETIQFDSIHDIDEEADGKIQTEAPLFDIIKDPTISKKAILPNPHSDIERDRWVLQQAKQTASKLDVTAKKKGLGVKTGRHFSGAIYKRMLDAKEKEITDLRRKLFESLKREENENDSVRKLKNALNKSVNYYTFAEEWQNQESLRLQADVKRLKNDISSLMAFLINSEVEKQNLMNEMKELNSKIENAEKESGKAIEESKAMKLKLQESFKEFIAIDGTMKQLRKEAIKGTDAVEARNVMLQKNLTKLTADFEITSKELRTSNSKTRELEYELEQMIKELNSKGEALKKSTQMNSNLKANLEATTNELRELQQNHEQLILQKAKIEADARQDNINNEHQKQDLRKTLKKTSEELNQVAAEKLDLEMVIRTNKQEIETLKKQVKTYSTEKDDLTISLNNTKKLYQTDMAIREQKISELNNRIAKDQVTLKAVQEKKEQLMFEVTDLQNNLSSETDIVKSLTGDLAQLKRTTEEKINLLNEQIEKLNVTKNNLVNDKKELGEKIKSCRQELRQRDEELEETIKKFEDFQTNSGSEIAGLDRKLKSSQEDNRILNKAHDDLKGRYTDSVKENVGLKREREQLQRKQTEKELAIATSTIQALVADKDELIKNLEMSRKQGDDLETRIKTSLERNNSVYSEYTAYKKNAETVMEDQTVEIRRLKEDLMETHGHNKLLTYKKTQLEKSLADTETKLSETSSKLITETKTREILEEQLDQNRIAYMNEKRMRVELERVQTHIKYNDASRVIGSWSEWKTRDRKLADLAIGLVQESSRLTQLVNLLPVKDGFGNETEFEWPNDIPAGAKKKKL